MQKGCLAYEKVERIFEKIFRTQDGTLRCGWLLALGLLVTAGLRDAAESAAALVAGAFALPLAAGGMGVTLLANTTQAAARWAGCAAMGAGALMSWHFFTKRPLSEMGLGVGRGCARRFGLGAAQGAAGALAVFGALAAVGLVKVEVLAPALRATAIERALFYGAVALAHGLFYQGFCLCAAKRLHGVWGTWGAVALAALLYALGQAPGSASLWWHANNLLQGGAFAAMALYTGDIWMAVGAHWLWNVVWGPVLGFAAGGLRAPGLWQAQYTAAGMWNGGAQGPEGGAAVTLLAMAWLAAWLTWGAARSEAQAGADSAGTAAA